jgi:hypothetical protein
MTSVKLDDELLDGIEQFIAHRNEPPRGKMSYDDAVNVIIEDWLIAQGYLSLPNETNAATKALDAAEVPEV